MRFAYIGNFGPPHSTENHIKRALEWNGHEVIAIQENEVGIWHHLAKGEFGLSAGLEPDVILWTRTGWDYASLGYSSQEQVEVLQWKFLHRAAVAKIPTVAYHLDLFFGLGERRVAILDEPFFQCDVVITADGGHPAEFAAKDINHTWFPPAVSLAETEPGMYREEYASPIAFVGSWQGGYHPEHRHRHELVAWLQQHYARDCRFWPAPGHPAVRGADLRDLYASTTIVIGDSCFAGQVENYWSDRIPETLGRGGFLLHPYVPGLGDQFPDTLPIVWDAGNWDDLREAIYGSLHGIGQEERTELTTKARTYVREHHTYERRMEQLVDLLHERNYL